MMSLTKFSEESLDADLLITTQESELDLVFLKDKFSIAQSDKNAMSASLQYIERLAYETRRTYFS